MIITGRDTKGRRQEISAIEAEALADLAHVDPPSEVASNIAVKFGRSQIEASDAVYAASSTTPPSPTNTDIDPNLVCDLLDQSWWCTVSSLSNVMGLQNANEVAARVSSSHKRKYEVRCSSGGVSETWCVDEAGLEHILSTSRTDAAKAFLAWLKKRAESKGVGTPPIAPPTAPPTAPPNTPPTAPPSTLVVELQTAFSQAFAPFVTQMAELAAAVNGTQLAVRQPGPATPAVLQQPLSGMLQDPEPLPKTARQDVFQIVDTIVARRVVDPARYQENVGCAGACQHAPRHGMATVTLAEDGNRLVRRSEVRPTGCIHKMSLPRPSIREEPAAMRFKHWLSRGHPDYQGDGQVRRFRVDVRVPRPISRRWVG